MASGETGENVVRLVGGEHNVKLVSVSTVLVEKKAVKGRIIERSHARNR